MSKTLPSGWLRVRLGALIREVSIRRGMANQHLSVLSVTNTQGFVRSADYFEGTVHSNDLSKYKVIRTNQFAYNPSRINVGSLARLANREAGVVSPMYVVFEVTSKELEPEFLQYWFSTQRARRQIIGSARGTVRQTVPFQELAGFWIDLPPLAEQQTVTTVLRAVNEAIEANRGFSAHTRQLRRALAKRLLIEGLPRRHRRFKDSPIGRVPTDWELKTLGSLLREPIRNGYSANAVEEPTGRWILSLSAVSERGFNPAGVKPLALDENGADAFALKPDDLLVSRSNTKDKVGFSGIYDGNPVNCAYPDLLMRVRVRQEEIDNKFLEYWLLSPIGRRYFSTHARGTSGSMVKINRAILESFPVPVPPLEEQKDIAAAIARAIRSEEKATVLVDQLRKASSVLTQILMSGHEVSIERSLR